MSEYDKERGPLTHARLEANKRALEQFLLLLGARDAGGLERLLAEDVISVSDGGGEVHAALQPIRGRDKVLRFITGLSAKYGGVPASVFRVLNGAPALLFEVGGQRPGFATRFVIHCEIDGAGRIRRFNTVLAPRKLSAIS